MAPLVSVVIAAHNAEDTLTAAVRSLEAQTHPRWEAIIVDDGSTDGTADMAALLARRDGRYRFVSQRRAGPSSARNRGLADAEGEFVLFLDGDDILLPRHLELLLDAIDERVAGWAACAWARLAPDGAVYDENWPPDEDLVLVTARTCPWAIHACLTSRRLLDQVGGFDDDLATCEDWELWQRIARLRPRLATVDEVLALYRTSSGSRSSALDRLLTDGLDVIRRGHRHLPAVDPGAPAEVVERSGDAVAASWYLGAWVAGRAAGSSADLAFLDGVGLPSGAAPSLDAGGLAEGLVDGLVGASGSFVDACEAWQRSGADLQSFLGGASRASGRPDLARQVARRVERSLGETVPLTGAIRVGATAVVPLAVGESPAALPLSPAVAGAERVIVRLHEGGVPAGTVEVGGEVEGPISVAAVQRAIPLGATSPTGTAAPPRRRTYDSETTRRLRHAYRTGRAHVVSRGRRVRPELFPPRRHLDGAVPVLMYHRVAPDGPSESRRWRVTPSAFEAHLAALQRLGCHTIDLATWRAWQRGERELQGRPVVLTFDDGYRDFADHAWPALRRFGFGATVFVVTDHVGATNAWDAQLTAEAPLLDWDDLLRLVSDGVEIGSHTCSHRALTGLAPAELDHQLRTSRSVLEGRLGIRVTSLAYPYGDWDPGVASRAAEAGYDAALTCDWGSALQRSDPWSLPRIEVEGDVTGARLVDLLPFDRTR